MLARALMWITAGLLVYAQAGYAAALVVLTRGRTAPRTPAIPDAELPFVSLILAAHNEDSVIAAKVANALSLDYPPHRFEVIVASDGSTDGTVVAAQAAGAHRVLDLPRGGKVRAQDAGVDAARGELLAFSDANAQWEPDALRALVAALADPQVGYACGRVTFVSAEDGTNQEGLYWRYEMGIRARESALSSVTAGNGAIYAVRREAYVRCDPVMGHDLAMPFQVVKNGRRAIDVPEARATEKMVPTIEGELKRKRRMMSHAWPIVLRGGLLDPSGYSAAYAWQVFSHRLLRYAGPFLHAKLLAATLVLARRSKLARMLLAAQVALLAAAVAGGAVRSRPLLVARYYVLTEASIALGLLDHLRHGTPAGWDPPEGTR
ncbi:MAG: glycosyltransferase [Solirubrobacteraceae bacterium]|nr:glycosyltransferase [Solirubrobacteraceae bacterium]